MRMFKFYQLAREVRRESEKEMSAYLAWKIQEVKATKRIGKKVKPWFEDFNDFYNHEEQFNLIFSKNVTHKKHKKDSMAELNRIF